jgi:hypothetical protein
MTEWKVYLNGKHIISIFYDGNMSAEDIRKRLIEYRHYDSRIVVKKANKNDWIGSLDIEPIKFGDIEL